MANPRTVKELVRHVQRYKRLSGITPTEVIRRLVEHIVEDGQGHTILGTFDLEDLDKPKTSAPKGPKVRNWDGGFVGTHKQHSLDQTLTRKDIQTILGAGVKNQGMSGDRKVKNQWEFTVDGEYASIWDYYGARWSGYGPASVFQKLGIAVEGK